MLSGRIGKAEDMPGWWWADCNDVRAHTQGRSRADALSMLADCIELMATVPIKVRVRELEPLDGDEIEVSIECDQPEELADIVRRQR